ncbi:RHS repeat-associated core domain-containing protein [Pseudomonas sp.]|uniref:RHS repeat-associated core domain-containing protein n=1 Tax=Pseudomonas sp. TaxID=306 RepID=UPI0028ADDB9D|nr:RHS repeat-associated core domain-containing protein [Pseudomonas sp.]
MKRSRCFYINDHLQATVTGSVATVIFQADKVILASRTAESTTSLLSTTGDRTVIGSTQGGTTHSHTFAVYGHLTKTEGRDLPLAYKGEHRSSQVGYLLGNGHRLYATATMRFYSPDAHSPFGSGWLNCYVYVQGDPVNASDPTGRWMEHIINPWEMKIPRVSTRLRAQTGPRYTKPTRHSSDPLKIKLERTWTSPTSVPLDDVVASAFHGVKPLRPSAKASEWKDFYDLRLTLRAARTDQVISNLQLHEAIQIPTSRKTFARLISEIETARLLEVTTSWHLRNLRGEPFTIPQTLGQIRRTS